MMFIKKAIALCQCFNYVGNLVTMAKDENVSTQAPQGQTAGFRSKSFFFMTKLGLTGMLKSKQVKTKYCLLASYTEYACLTCKYPHLIDMDDQSNKQTEVWKNPNSKRQ